MRCARNAATWAQTTRSVNLEKKLGETGAGDGDEGNETRALLARSTIQGASPYYFCSLARLLIT